MKKNIIKTCAMLAVAICTSAAMADTFTVTFQQGLNGYNGTLDTYIREDKANNSYGNDDHFQMDNNIDNAWFNWEDGQGLLKFTNLFIDQEVEEGTTSLNFIPTNATITAATLKMYCDNDGDGGEMYRMTRDWNESSTWNSLGGGAGNDTSSKDADLTGSTGWQSYSVTSAIQSWQGGAANYGWALLPEGVGDSTIYRSSEYSNASYRPSLTVTFDVATVPEPATAGLLAAGAVASLLRRRKRNS